MVAPVQSPSKSASRASLVLALAVSGLSAILPGCVGNSEGRRGGPKAAYSGPEVRFDGEAAPKVVGRASLDKEGGLKVAWPGTSATVHFTGTAVSLDITESGDNQYLVLVDKMPKREKVIPVRGRSTVELVKGLSPGEHTVTVYKLNEPLVGSATFHAFILNATGEALPPAEEQRPELLLIGDSISAGYGNEGADETCGFSPDTENHFVTYAARAARELGADLTTVAWSGKGVFSNRGSQTDTETMSELWKKTLPAENVDFDFKSPEPRAVLINLGTNDFAPEVSDTAPFAAAYEALVLDVRSKYPRSHLFLLAGPLLSDDYPPGKQALSNVRAALLEIVENRRAASDEKIDYLEFSRATPDEGWGCDFHPSVKTHSRMAAQLIQALKEKAHL